MACDADRPTAGFPSPPPPLARLCQRGLGVGNRVHINFSLGAKLVAFAAGLAGMAHFRPRQGTIYYVQPPRHTLSAPHFQTHGRTLGLMDVEELDLLPVLLPDPMQLRILGYLQERPGGMADYRDLLDFLTEIPGSGYRTIEGGTPLRVRNWNNAGTTRMVRT